jgi:hypothetical protein
MRQAGNSGRPERLGYIAGGSAGFGESEEGEGRPD